MDPGAYDALRTHLQEALAALDAEKAKGQMAEAALAEATKQVGALGATVSQLKETSDAHAKRFSEAQSERRRLSVEGAILQAKADGRITPAMADLGLQEFMEGLDDTALAVKFSEGGKDRQLSRAAWFGEWLKRAPKVAHLGETARVAAAPQRGAGAAGFPAGIEFTEGRSLPVDEESRGLEAKARKLMEERKVPFREALQLARTA